jgi:hypothetical protein
MVLLNHHTVLWSILQLFCRKFRNLAPDERMGGIGVVRVAVFPVPIAHTGRSYDHLGHGGRIDILETFATWRASTSSLAASRSPRSLDTEDRIEAWERADAPSVVERILSPYSARTPSDR